MKIKNKILSGVCIMMLVCGTFFVASNVNAESNIANTLTTNPTIAPVNGHGGFRLVICDGPAELGYTYTNDGAGKITKGAKIPDYISCDFNGAMIQIQHLINVAMVLGVIAAIAGFSYAGFLLISMSVTGKMEDRKKAGEVFQKVVIGFVIMLVSWFVVYQIIDWITGNSALKYLLGNK